MKICILGICLLYVANGWAEPSQGVRIAYDLSPAQEAFLDTLQYRTFLYFWHEANPQNGLIKDRSTGNSPCSIAATGFGVAAWIVGVERGWITREQAAGRTHNLLHFLFTSEQSTDTLATGYQGFYYHFIDMQTGKRVWSCELSTIDTAWLLAGLRCAAQYFDGDMRTEAAIRALTDSVTFRVNWDWTTAGATALHPGSVTMSWRPERQFNRYGWVGLNEALYLYILAGGSGYKEIATAYATWLRYYKWQEPYEGLAHAIFPPLFGHQYSQVFVDFRGIADSYMREKNIDYFENSRRATLTQRFYAIENPNGWAGYDSLTWGLTACDGPGNKYSGETRKFWGYMARGTSGPGFEGNRDDGTIAPTAAGGSIVFAPEQVIQTLRALKERYGEKGLWGKYGFKDAFNPTLGWYDDDYLGIDQGPILLMIENLRTGLIWNLCMRDPVIRKGLELTGFRQN
jgi:hypothetical protein